MTKVMEGICSNTVMKALEVAGLADEAENIIKAVTSLSEAAANGIAKNVCGTITCVDDKAKTCKKETNTKTSKPILVVAAELFGLCPASKNGEECRIAPMNVAIVGVAALAGVAAIVTAAHSVI